MGRSQGMKLYTYWRSQASFRVRIALRLKGLVAETASLDLLKGDQFDPTYRTLNPEMVVPTLLDGDGPPLVQSLAILEYLEEKYPQSPILPVDLRARAHVRGLRKNAGNEIAEAGGTEREIMARLGHKAPQMAAHYTKRASQAVSMRSAVEKLERARALKWQT
jgi:maleylacetoacetate isomerase